MGHTLPFNTSRFTRFYFKFLLSIYTNEINFGYASDKGGNKCFELNEQWTKIIHKNIKANIQNEFSKNLPKRLNTLSDLLLLLLFLLFSFENFYFQFMSFYIVLFEICYAHWLVHWKQMKKKSLNFCCLFIHASIFTIVQCFSSFSLLNFFAADNSPWSFTCIHCSWNDFFFCLLSKKKKYFVLSSLNVRWLWGKKTASFNIITIFQSNASLYSRLKQTNEKKKKIEGKLS